MTGLNKPILVVQTAFLGDALLTTPLLRRIRHLYPQNPLWILVREPLRDVFETWGLVDRAFEVNKKNPEHWSALKHELRAVHFESILCLHESLRSALLVRQLSANQKIGYRQLWSFWAFDHRVDRPMSLPEPLRALAILGEDKAPANEWQALLADLDLKSKTAQVFVNRTLPQWARFDSQQRQLPQPTKKLQSIFERMAAGRWIVLAPGSVWPTKQWSKDGFVELAITLTKQNFGVIWSGSKTERALCDHLCHRAKEEHTKGQHLVVAGDLSINETLQLFQRTDLVVANDSGAQHMAAFVGRPVVSIFGPTVPEQGYIPWSEKSRIVQIDLPCRPCGSHGHKHCPIGTHACMVNLRASQVLSACHELLEPVS
jgi:heptosyltransferase-2